MGWLGRDGSLMVAMNGVGLGRGRLGYGRLIMDHEEDVHDMG